MGHGHPEALPLSREECEGPHKPGGQRIQQIGRVLNIQEGEVKTSKEIIKQGMELELRNWHSVIWNHIPKHEPQEFIIWHNKRCAWAENMKCQ